MSQDMVFPSISEAAIGGELIATTNGRDLHRALGVGRKFATWMRTRIKEYGFVKGADYETFSQIGEKGRPSVEYVVTLDMAKELAMVENNDQGRQVRRYFIQCERAAKGIPHGTLEQIRRTDGVARMVAGKVTALQRWTETVPAVAGLDLGGTVSAYQMIEMAGVPAHERQRGTAQMVTKRMIGFCADRQMACLRTPAELNPSRPYRFPATAVGAWLLGEDRGLELIRSQVDRMKAKKAAKGRATGQGALRLVPPEARA